MGSGPDIERVKEAVREEFSGYYEHAGGADYRYHHLVRVHRYVRALMEVPEVAALDFDPAAVELAALLHDIGRAADIEDGYLDPFEDHAGHAERGAEMVDRFVPDLSPGRLELVRDAIASHHGEPDTVEGRIVQDADRLDGFGVHDLWRMIHYAAERERTPEESLEYFRKEAVDRYEDELERFHFDAAREVAADRLDRHVAAVDRIETEWRGDDI